MMMRVEAMVFMAEVRRGGGAIIHQASGVRSVEWSMLLRRDSVSHLFKGIVGGLGLQPLDFGQQRGFPRLIQPLQLLPMLPLHVGRQHQLIHPEQLATVPNLAKDAK